MSRVRFGRFESLLSELKRRRVFRVAAAYVVIAFAALQAVDVIAPALRLPEYTLTLFVILAFIGFIAAVGLAWAFDVVPGASRATAEQDEATPMAAARAHALAPASDMPCVAVMPFLNLTPWAGAEAEFRRAIELSPSNADAYDFYGRLCGALGRFDEAVALVRRAQELDPLAHRTDLANAMLRAGRYDEAALESARAVDAEPENARAHATLGWAYLKQGKAEEGLAELERAVALAPEHVQWLAQLGQARAMTGDEAAARAILHQLERRAAIEFVSPYHLAFVHTGLGEHERALDLLERALVEGSGSVHGIRGSMLFASLRGHPRFKALVARINPAAVT